MATVKSCVPCEHGFHRRCRKPAGRECSCSSCYPDAEPKRVTRHEPLGKEEGIEQSYEAAKEKWKSTAHSIICSMPSGTKFTTNDLWEQLAELGIYTKENRAMGGVIRSARTQGLLDADYCQECGQERREPTPRESQHDYKVTVYTRSKEKA